jgi:hypothetical protein
MLLTNAMTTVKESSGPTGSAALIPKQRRMATAIAGLAWLGIVITGTIFMVAYSSTPGESGTPPTHWPEASSIRLDRQHPTLVMFLHPHCPCSRATVSELALLMANCDGRINAHVFFLQPAEMPADWHETDTWRETKRIPGVLVHQDDDGREARLFNAETSGDTALYDPHGNLLFHGGITIARGHSGDNPGRDAIQDLIFGKTTLQTNTPAFGCSLFECKRTENN